jgi:hypothetical protein
MDRMITSIIGTFLLSILFAAVCVEPGRTAASQESGGQVQSSQGVQPPSNYGTKLSERNAAAKQLSERNKSSKPRQTESAKNKSGNDKPRLSKRNQAVIKQSDAAKNRRNLIDKINADSSQK